MLRTAAYAWEKGGTKQVVYRAADGHIHELFVPVGGSWSHADLTQITGAPQPDPDSAFAGYEWEAGGSKQVVYVTPNGHIHELFVPVGGSWSHADLTQRTGAPLMFDHVSFTGYEWKAGGTKQVVYLTADGHIHELFVAVGGSWRHADLTQRTGAPPQNNAFPVITGYEWEAGGTKQVVYRPADGHIHELFVAVGGSWSHADLTQITGAPRPEPDTAFAGYEWKAGGSKQVVYRTEDGHIHELFVVVGGSWRHADLTQIAGAPPASTNSPIITGYEWEAGGTKQVVYLTADGHIHELFVAVGGSWRHADLTQRTSAPPVA